MWAAAYETDPPVKMLGETMADIAEEFATWKYRHLMATRRTIGNRSAYFGTRLCLGFFRRWKRFPFLNFSRPAPSSATNRQLVLT